MRDIKSGEIASYKSCRFLSVVSGQLSVVTEILHHSRVRDKARPVFKDTVGELMEGVIPIGFGFGTNETSICQKQPKAIVSFLNPIGINPQGYDV